VMCCSFETQWLECSVMLQRLRDAWSQP
jgi:hypothetical protein